jgi:hypothetical protein
MALENHIFYFIFVVFALFAFLPLFFRIPEWEEHRVSFSAVRMENTPIFYDREALYIIRIVWNTSD